MPDFLALPRADREEALLTAQTALGRPPHLLEKDILVVWALQHLFSGQHAAHLVFKGGTSLSKAYGVINRFSEDVDLTYDIRAIAPDLVGQAGGPLPPSRSQSRKWTTDINERLAKLVANEMLPPLEQALAKTGLPAKARVEVDRIFIDYEPIFTGNEYTPPSVMLEFGARSTGEPSAKHHVVCDAAQALGSLAFPEIDVITMKAERTFWEKATAVHVFCETGRFRGGPRYARHWYDLVQLDRAGLADAAFADKALAKAVADHKTAFFAESGVDYHAAIAGGLRLVPENGPRDELELDYKRMTDAGMFMGQPEPFDQLMEHCKAIEAKVPKAA